MRYCKYVAVAQSRNACAVASKTLRVYRRKTGGRKSAWDTRPISHKELLRQRSRAGFITRKAADLDDDVEEIIDPLHPLVSLLTSANPIMNGQQLFEQTQLGVGLTGDAYWHVVSDGSGTPVELWPLAPQYVRTLPSRDTIVGGYIYGRGTENEVELDAGEVVRFTQPNPRGDPFKGFGDLEKCIDAADLSVAFDHYRLNTIDNGAQPGLILIDRKGGIEQRQQLEDQLQRKFGGLAKVGRSMVLTGDIEIQPWSMNEKEVSFLASDAAVRETIANCHDLPVALLTLDSAALATAKSAIPQWEQIGIKPRCDRIADTLNQFLVPMFGDDRLYVCYEEIVTKDMEAAAIRVRTLYTGDEKSIITLNEARAELDYDAVPGGDIIPEPKPEPDPFGFGRLAGDGGGKPPMDEVRGGEDDEDEPEEPERDSEKSAGPTVIINNHHGHAEVARKASVPVSQRALILGAEPIECCPNHPRSITKDGTDPIDSTERRLEALIRNMFGGLGTDLAPLVNQGGLPSSARKVIERGLALMLEEPIRSIFTQGYNYGVQELPQPGNAQIMAALTGPVEKYLREHGGKMIRSVSETVDTAIRERLAEGVAAGESVPQLTQRLQDSVTEMGGVAAEGIARTETARAFMAARERSWMDSGIIWGKRWQLAPNACEFCEAASANYGVQPLGQPFFKQGSVLTGSQGGKMRLDYADVDGPPLHPNDRCNIVYVTEKP